MKHFFLLLSFSLIVAVVFIERAGMVWPCERPLITFLASVTNHPLPMVTSVKLPSDQGILLPQDVALTLRAVVTFYPRAILVTEPLGDLSSGPVSLIKEGLETDCVRGVPVFFAAHVDKKNHESSCAPANLLVFPEEKNLPTFDGKLEEHSPMGFVFSNNNSALPMMPLLARAGEHLVASLWWRGLFLAKEESTSLPLLLGGRFLQLPNHATIFLNEETMLKPASTTNIKTLLLEDLLLHREEMERGSIRPDFDALFRNKVVLIGSASVISQAAALQQALQQASVARLSTALYGALLLLFSFAFIAAARTAWIDFLLIVIFLLLLYGGLGFFLFRSYELLLPVFLPLVIVLVIMIRKLIEERVC